LRWSAGLKVEEFALIFEVKNASPIILIADAFPLVIISHYFGNAKPAKYFFLIRTS